MRCTFVSYYLHPYWPSSPPDVSQEWENRIDELIEQMNIEEATELAVKFVAEAQDKGTLTNSHLETLTSVMALKGNKFVVTSWKYDNVEVESCSDQHCTALLYSFCPHSAVIICYLYPSRAGLKPLMRIWVAAGPPPRGNRTTAINDYCVDCTWFTENPKLSKEYPPAGIELALKIFIASLNPTL